MLNVARLDPNAFSVSLGDLKDFYALTLARAGTRGRLCVLVVPNLGDRLAHRRASILVRSIRHAGCGGPHSPSRRIIEYPTTPGPGGVPAAEDADPARYVWASAARKTAADGVATGLFLAILTTLQSAAVPSETKALVYHCLTKMLSAMELNYKARSACVAGVQHYS